MERSYASTQLRAGQKQHVELFRKIGLRRRLMEQAVPGAAYVPFIGDGDIAALLYADRPVYGADINPSRVEVASSRLPRGQVLVADCNGWPFAGISDPIAVADIDAYANPYRSLTACIENAVLCHRVVIFGTDGLRQSIKRHRMRYVLPDVRESDVPRVVWRAQYNFWWSRYVLPFLASLVEPFRIVRTEKYLRKDMLYWGAIIER